MNNYELFWFEIEPSILNGKGWTKHIGTFNRLPDYCEPNVPKDVWKLSRHSTGLYLRFKTNSTRIHARWSLGIDELALPHMPATSVSGLDLYAKDFDDRWRWVGVGRPESFPTIECCLNYGLPNELEEYMLYLPLHNILTHISIGVEKSAFFDFISPPKPNKPIVYYGTSVVHGIAASRAGMCHASILGRNLDYQVVNLGFSGRGKMEIEMAQLIAEIDASLYILDCLPNMPPQLVDTRVMPFVNSLRAIQPDTPILLIEDRSYANSWIIKTLAERNQSSRAILASQYDLLRHQYDNLYYLPDITLIGDDNEGTVDGSHPNDLGFYRFAKVLLPIVTDILNHHSKH